MATPERESARGGGGEGREFHLLERVCSSQESRLKFREHGRYMHVWKPHTSHAVEIPSYTISLTPNATRASSRCHTVRDPTYGQRARTPLCRRKQPLSVSLKTASDCELPRGNNTVPIAALIEEKKKTTKKTQKRKRFIFRYCEITQAATCSAMNGMPFRV